MNILNISINEASVVPKYLQLADAITVEVATGRLTGNTMLPSIHRCCCKMNVSKNTVEKAYNVLKANGIIGSFKGKGYYVL